MKIAILCLAMPALALPAAAQSDPAKTPAPGPAAARTQAAEPQSPTSAGASTSFTAEQLEQIVAPIALHPDSLLAQILMASTYPLEIVEAYRWQQKNPSLKEKALEEALQKQEWDPAVKSICGLPSVLKQMNDSLDWTQDLGDAFLGQKEDLMKTVQVMRKKALEAGTLKSGEQQTVSQDGDVVIIESTKTEVVYVPTYYPTAVYGAWSYPYYYYPPMYPPYPAGGLMFGFTVGVIWGGCWGGCNWGGNDVDIDINQQNNFIDRTERPSERQNVKDRAGTGAKDRAGNKGSFKHDPGHRKGANYKNPQTAQKYGASAGSNRVSKDQARGYDRSGSKGGSGAGGQKPSTGNASRPSAGNASRPSTGNAGAKATPRSSSGGSSAMSGSRSPGADRSASSRGSASRGGGGGASRGGGGRGGGGGRR